MNANGYKLLRYAVWHGGKWYLRGKLPSTRVLVIAGFAGGSLLLAAAILGRRLQAPRADESRRLSGSPESVRWAA